MGLNLKKMLADALAGVGNAPQWLDSHPLLPLALLGLLPFAAHSPQWLLGLSSDPMLLYSGLVQGGHAGLLPNFPYLDPNVGYTTQALGYLSTWDWLHGIVPWWNSYSGIGKPLAGEITPSAFFLPFNLLLLLPDGVLWLTVTMQILAGLSTYALLRELGLSRMAALMGGALYALNGTIAWGSGPVAIFPFAALGYRADA